MKMANSVGTSIVHELAKITLHSEKSRSATALPLLLQPFQLQFITCLDLFPQLHFLYIG